MPTIFPFLKQGKRQPSSPPGTNGGTSAPPKSQPSKHRPRNKGHPRSLRDTLLHSLPTYSGPYPVGLLELELPVPSPRSFGPVKRSGRHALTLETTLFNIFYPAALGTGTGPDPSGNKKWSRATWLPRPRKLTSNGYSTFSGIPPPAMLTFFFLTSWLTKIPAFRNAKIAEHWPPPHSARTGGEHVKLTSGDIPEGLPDDAKPAFPLLIFSHGLGGSRSVYSSVCGEFASYGFIVVAVEHRDGSGSRSVVNYGPESEFLWEEVVPRPPTLIKEPTIPDNPNYFDKERQEKAKRIGKKPKRAVTEALRNGRGGELVDEKGLSPLDSSKKSWRVKRKGTKARKESLESQRTYRTVDYLWPRDNPYDTDPSNKVDSELRSCQINMRKAELAEIYRIITLINDGNGDVLTQLNLKKKGAAGASSRGLEGVDWESWKGRVQIKNVTVAGHSFGAASTIEVLRYPKEIFGDAELDSLQGIIYDPWGAAIQEPDSKAAQIKTPLLGINSEAFMHWSDNFDLVQKVFDEASSNSPDKCWMMTLKGTVHISQSDFTIIYPRLCAALLKAAADPERAMDININASLEFLKRVMPPSVAEWNRVDDEGVLDVGVKGLDDEERLVRRPTGEGKVAKVLKKEKGWRRRMVMQAPSSVRRRLNRGKQMEGEVWMHLRPGEREDGEEVVKVEVPGVATENGGIGGQTENPQAREDSSSSDVRDPSPTGKKLK